MFWPLLLAAVAAALVAFAIGTQTGTRIALRGAERALGGVLEVEQVEGRLLDTLTVRGLRFADPPHAVVVARASLAWRPLALIESRLLRVERIEVSDAAYTGPEPAPDPAPPGPPPLDLDVVLPLEIEVGRLVVRRLRIQRGRDADAALELGPISADDVTIRQSVRVGRLELEAFGARAAASGEVGLRPPNAVSLSLDWAYPLDGIAPGSRATGAGTIEGRLREVRLVHALGVSPGGAARERAVLKLEGSVALPAGATYPEVDLSARWRDLAWPLAPGARSFESKVGRMTLRGKPAAFAIEIAGDASLPDLPVDAVSVRLDGGLDPGDPIGSSRFDVAWTLYPDASAPFAPARPSGRGSVRSDGTKLELEHRSDAPFALDLSGTLQRKRPGPEFSVGNIERFDLHASWRDLRWPLAAGPGAEGVFTSRAGTLNLAGRPGSFGLRLDTDADAAGIALEALEVALDATLDPARPLSTAAVTLDWRARPVPGGPIEFDEVTGRTSIAVTSEGRRLELGHRSTAPFELSADASLDRRSGGAAFDPEDIERLALALRWRELRWPLVGVPQLESRDGELRLEGPLDALGASFETVLAIPGVPIEAVEVKAEGSVAPVHPYAFDLGLRWRVGLDASVSGERFDGRGAGRFAGDMDRIRLDHALEAPFRLATLGQVAIGAPVPRLDIEGDWQALRWPPQPSGAALLTSESGRYTLRGPADDLDVTVSASVAGADVPAAGFDLSAKARRDGLPGLVLDVRTLGGTARAEGAVRWSDGLAVDLGLSADGIDPGVHWPGAGGQLAVRAAVKGEMLAGGPSVALDLERLAGTLRGQRVAGAGKLSLEGTRVEAREFRLGSGANSVRLDGVVGEEAALRFELDAPALASLWPGLEGRAAGSGRIAGARERPTVELDVEATGLGFDAFGLDSLRLGARVDSADRQPSKLELGVRGLTAGDARIDRLDLEGQGRLGRHRVDLDLVAPQGKVRAGVEGGLEPAKVQWRGRVNRLEAAIKDLAGHGLGTWSLARPAAVEARADAARADDLCLVQAGASVCLGGRWRAGSGVDAALRASALPLALARPWLPPTVELNGLVSASAKAAGQGAGLQASAEATVSGARLRLDRGAGTPVALELSRVALDAAYGNDEIDAEFALGLAGGGGLEGRAKLGRAGAGGARPLSGLVTGGLPDLKLLAAFTDALARLEGRIEVDARLSGTTAAPGVAGGVRLLDAGADVADAGIRVEPIRFEARGEGGERLKIEGEARSGEGSLRMTGAVRLAPERGWPSDLRIEGERFEAARLPNVAMLVSPALDISVDDRGVSVSGTVKVPESRITIDEIPPSAVKLSADEVIVRKADGSVAERARAEQVGPPAELDVTVELGDAVSFEGFGLLTRLAGSLRVRQSPGQPPSAAGELVLREGTFKAYGQDLKIERGRLVFTGPIDNPGVDIRATRTSGSVVAGVEVSGTVNALESTLFSTPAMSQAQALSYLLTGRPLSGASGGEGQMVAQAAFALGVGNAQGITKEIGSALGLDELSVAGEDIESAGVKVGKRIGSRIYARYVVGLFDTLGSLELSYQLTDSLRIEAQTGQTQGLDLIYSIEREKLFGGSSER